MSTQELFDEFVSEFVRPLVNGQEAQNLRFLPAHLLTNFAHGAYSDNEVAQAIHEGLLEAVADIMVASHLPFPEHGAMAAAMAGHNLLALTDPLLDRTFARSSRKQVLEWVAALIEAMDAPHTRGQALCRHAIVHRLMQVRREDTVVRNWAYTYRFYGRPPPANVVALPKLRFVREEKTKRPIRELLSAEELDLAGSLSALIERSPITSLIEHEICDVSFGAAVLAVLSDGGLRHGIEQAIVKRGTASAAAPFGRAFRELSALGPEPEFLYPAVAFLAELQVLEVFDDRSGHRPKDEPAVGDEELFSAILPALLEEEGPMASLIQLEEYDLAKVKERADMRRKQAGEDAVAFARSVIQRAAPLHLEQPTPLQSHNSGAGW